MRISKYYGEIPMAHMLVNHDRRCQHLHGHNYQLTVTVEGDLITEKGHPKEGMVIDFTDLKELVKPIVDGLDHSTIVSGDEPVELLNIVTRKAVLGKRTTVENIALSVFEQIHAALEIYNSRNGAMNYVSLYSIEMWETMSSKVTVTQDDI